MILCCGLFGAMALGSGSPESGETKQVVSGEKTTTVSAFSEDGTPQQTDNEEAQPTIEQQMLLDQDGIVITAQEYVTDRIWGDGIKLLVENNSDQDVMVGCDALIVNDYMITDLFAASVAAGKKDNETLYLSDSELKAAGIENVGQVELYFHVSDNQTYDRLIDNAYACIKTSLYDEMDTTPNDEGVELYNEGGIRIVGKTVDENSFWGTAILLYCENNSGKNVGISAEDVSVNGFMMNALFSETVYDGKKLIDDITIFSSDLEENGIETVENVELKFHIYDADSYSTIADSEPITFSAQ